MAKRSKQDTEAIREAVYNRSGGRCECTADDCAHHSGRCGAQLRSRWDVLRKNPGGAFSAWNLQALCVRCHRNARAREAKGKK